MLWNVMENGEETRGRVKERMKEGDESERA
jgi:hypothetical protein